MSWAITGTGMVSSVGGSVSGSFEAFCRGETGLAPLRAFDSSKYRVRHAYEVPDRRAGRDEPGRATAWLCDVVAQAVEQARLGCPAGAVAAPGGAGRVPVLIGTGLAEQRSLELWWTGDAPVSIEDLDFSDALACQVGLGPTYNLVNACSAGLFALALGTDLLALGEADAVVVAGTDAITESMFGLLDRVTMEPPTEVRPFDVDRRGVILGEGAAAIVLEPEARARERGARPLALVRGVGTSCDANHLTAPLLAGITRAMRDAHQRSEVTADDIDVVLAHGTGTVLNDETEARALREVFGDLPRRPLVTALKSLTGHTSGASGLMSLVTAVESLATGRVPPTRHHAAPIDAISRFPVVTRPIEGVGLRRAQVDAFGFGGVNAVVVVEQAPATAAVVRDAEPARVPPTNVAVTGIGIAVPGLGSVADLLARPGEPVPSASFVPHGVLGRRGLRYKDRASQLALCAAAATLADAGLPWPRDERVEAESFGVVVSTTNGISETVCRVAETIHRGGVVSTQPMDLPNASGNVASASVAIWFGLEGFNLTLSAGSTSGLDAVHCAAVAIRAGRARRMLVIGVEPAGPAASRLVAGAARRHGVRGIPRLFDGAAALLLEASDAVAERGGRVQALVGGYGRDARLDAAVCAALDATPDRGVPELWLTPCTDHRLTSTEIDRAAALPSVGSADRVDVGEAVGEALAALGVLQCAVAAAWLTARPGQRALVSSGGCWGAEYAGLTLGGTE